MKSNRFYLACLRDTVGTNVVFHCIDSMCRLDYSGSSIFRTLEKVKIEPSAIIENLFHPKSMLMI